MEGFRMKVYVSGPITGLPLGHVRAAFKQACEGLADRGYTPVNPTDIPVDADCGCTGAGRDGAGSGHAWACYLRKDIRALVDCDAILMLPGWEPSHGARLELTVASAVGLRVFWEMPDADASIIWEYDPRLGDPYLEPMRAMISHDSMERP
jgi:hypothetical protein